VALGVYEYRALDGAAGLPPTAEHSHTWNASGIFTLSDRAAKGHVIKIGELPEWASALQMAATALVQKPSVGGYVRARANQRLSRAGTASARQVNFNAVDYATCWRERSACYDPLRSLQGQESLLFHIFGQAQRQGKTRMP